MMFNHFLGAILYQRGILVFLRHVEYWEEAKLPLFHLFSSNPTFFSEESGEIAISVLVQSLPVNHNGDLKATQRYHTIHVLKMSDILANGVSRGFDKMTKSCKGNGSTSRFPKRNIEYYVSISAVMLFEENLA